MAQEQRSNLDLFQAQEDLENLEVDFNNVNLGSVDCQTYNLDVILNEIDMMEDLNIADDIFSKLQSELQDKSENLKNTQQQTADKKSELNSSKYYNLELEQLQRDEQNTANCLTETIEKRRLELDQLHTQQVNNLFQFESDVQKITDNFMSGPKFYEYDSLIEKVVQMKKEVENECSEMFQYKQDLQVSAGNRRHGQNTNGALLEKSISPFEECVEDITTLNEKLTTSVEQITNRFNTLRFKVNCLTQG